MSTMTENPGTHGNITNYLQMKAQDWEATEWDVGDESLFTFTTSSRGGLSAIGELCKIYGKHMRQRPE